MRSYTSQQKGVCTFVEEIVNLYRAHSANIPQRVQDLIRQVQEVEGRVEQRFSLGLRNLDILEIGPGQFLSQMTYFALHNCVVGIDLDVIALGWRPIDYVRMLKSNGVRRTIKTVGRKLVGIDKRHRSELMKQLNLRTFPRMTVLRMDVCRMSFPDNSFDFVYSRSVFHSLPRPADAVREVARVLRPGGVAYIWPHLYTSANGSLDPRIYVGFGLSGDLRLWPHLRPQLSRALKPNAYVNKLRLAKWRQLFSEAMPGVEFTLNRESDPELEKAARALQARGELLEYTLEELTTHDFVALWRKPQ